MAHADTAHAEAHAHAEPTSFVWKYVFSKDHKVIGVQYYVTAMLMALVAGTLAMLIRLQLAGSAPPCKLRMNPMRSAVIWTRLRRGNQSALPTKSWMSICSRHLN